MSERSSDLPPTVVSMGDLSTALVASDTDEFLVCQKAGGCGPNDPLARMSMAQVSDYILSKGNTGIVGITRDVDLSIIGDNEIPLVLPPTSQTCILTGIYAVNPSRPGNTALGQVSTGPLQSGRIVAGFTAYYPDMSFVVQIADSTSTQLNQRSLNSSLYLYITMPEPTPMTVDIYLIGFPLI